MSKDVFLRQLCRVTPQPTSNKKEQARTTGRLRLHELSRCGLSNTWTEFSDAHVLSHGVPDGDSRRRHSPDDVIPQPRSQDDPTANPAKALSQWKPVRPRPAVHTNPLLPLSSQPRLHELCPLHELYPRMSYGPATMPVLNWTVSKPDPSLRKGTSFRVCPSCDIILVSLGTSDDFLIL